MKYYGFMFKEQEPFALRKCQTGDDVVSDAVRSFRQDLFQARTFINEPSIDQKNKAILAHNLYRILYAEIMVIDVSKDSPEEYKSEVVVSESTIADNIPDAFKDDIKLLTEYEALYQKYLMLADEEKEDK